jgi:hypothetical protein
VKKPVQFEVKLKPLHLIGIVLGAILLLALLIGGAGTGLSKISMPKGEKTEKEPFVLQKFTSPPGTLEKVRITRTQATASTGEYSLILWLPRDEDTESFLQGATAYLQEYKTQKEKEKGHELTWGRMPWKEGEKGKIRDENYEELFGSAEKPEEQTPSEPSKEMEIAMRYREVTSFNLKGKTIKTVISVYDVNGEDVTGTVVIPDGVRARVASELVPWLDREGRVGAHMRPKGIQLLEEVEKTPLQVETEIPLPLEDGTLEEPKPKSKKGMKTEELTGDTLPTEPRSNGPSGPWAGITPLGTDSGLEEEKKSPPPNDPAWETQKVQE